MKAKCLDFQLCFHVHFSLTGGAQPCMTKASAGSGCLSLNGQGPGFVITAILETNTATLLLLKEDKYQNWQQQQQEQSEIPFHFMLILEKHSNANRLMSAEFTRDSICLIFQLNQQSDKSPRITFWVCLCLCSMLISRPRLALA